MKNVSYYIAQYWDNLHGLIYQNFYKLDITLTAKKCQVTDVFIFLLSITATRKNVTKLTNQQK